MPLELRKHEVSVVPNPQAGFSRYQFVARCSCQFEALAVTEEHAKDYLRQHLFRHDENYREVK